MSLATASHHSPSDSNGAHGNRCWRDSRSDLVGRADHRVRGSVRRPQVQHPGWQGHRDPFVRTLAHEWSQLLADPTSTDRVADWASQTDCLATCATLDDVLAAIADAADEVLWFLLVTAHHGDDLAGRVVLQAMLPKMVSFARKDPDFGVADFVGWLWIRIESYPVHRRSSVAANLALDTLKQATKSRDTTEHACFDSTEQINDLIMEARSHDGLVDHDDVASLTAVRVIKTAVELGLVDAPSAAILHSVYAEGLSGREAAVRHDLSVDTVRARCARAVRRLAAHSAELLDAA